MLSHLKRAWRMLDRQARRQLLVLGLMTVFAGVFEALGVSMVFPFIKIIADPHWLNRFALFATWAPRLGLDDRGRMVTVLGVGMIGLFVVKNAYLITFYTAQFTIAYGNTARYSTQLLGHYLRAPYLMHLQRNSAELIRNVRELPRYLFNVMLAVIAFSTEALVVAMVGGVLLVAQPMATLMAAALLGVITAVFYTVAGRMFAALGGEELARSASSQLALQQALGGVKDSRIVGCEDFFVRCFDREAMAIMKVRRSMQVISQIPRLSVELAMMAGMILVVMVMAAKDGGTAAMLPRLAVFAAAAFRLMPSVNRMTLAFNDLKVSTIPLVELEADLFGGQMLPPSPKGPRRRLDRTLELDAVSFTYPGASQPAIAGIDLTIHRGETIGLVGPSGAGKSTLVDVVLGLLVPTDGCIRLDGHEIATGGGWHGTVGYVPQSIFITDDTIRRNVAFGVEDADIDSAAVARALEMARMDQFVAGLPAGLDTRLDENGVRLSGGQRQRIGIARALYHDPDLLVFDEATSALDPLTERDITAAIRALHGHKTVIIIAHRLSTVRHCDSILMIDRGRVADCGRFDDLAARNPAFRRLMEALEMNTTITEEAVGQP